MAQLRHRGLRRGGAALGVVLCLCGAAASARDRDDDKTGRLLADVLRTLPGMRIVFSSEIVTPHMRVISEPRASRPRDLLDEILKPHGLRAEDGPGGVIQIVRAPQPTSKPARRGREPDGRSKTTQEPARLTYAERVFVTGATDAPRDPGAGAETAIVRADLQQLGSMPSDDPQRIIHTLPGVAAESDFRGELSVRGSPYRHIGIFLDGISAPWLQHAIAGRDDVGSVTMVSADVLAGARVQAGAYPQRHGARLGAQLELTLREGSRAATHVSGTIGGTNAALVTEGPIGRSAGGSWLVALRQSYRDWPIRRRTFDGTVLGFTDLQAKMVYDVNATQQISVTTLAGRMGADGPDSTAAGALARATSEVGVVSVGWRSVASARFVVTQQVHAASREYRNTNAGNELAALGGTRELSYRADAVSAVSGGLLEAGGQIQQIREARTAPADERFDSRGWLRSGYVNYSWQSRTMTVTPGVRVTDSSRGDRPAISRWLLAEWRFARDWALHGSGAISWQFPELEYIEGPRGFAGLQPERARHLDVGVEQRHGRSMRWRATLFTRDERDIVSLHERYENAIAGRSRGVEMLVERRALTGLSGWAAYSYGSTRHTDVQLGDTFRALFDQRHAVTVVGAYGFSDRTRASASFRGGSNFPGLPSYARLDVRAQRGLDVAGNRLTVFAEILNVLNHRNMGRTSGTVQPLMPRVGLAGIRVDF